MVPTRIAAKIGYLYWGISRPNREQDKMSPGLDRTKLKSGPEFGGETRLRTANGLTHEPLISQ
jgi:hypothetical protein